MMPPMLPNPGKAKSALNQVVTKGHANQDAYRFATQYPQNAYDGPQGSDQTSRR